VLRAHFHDPFQNRVRLGHCLSLRCHPLVLVRDVVSEFGISGRDLPPQPCQHACGTSPLPSNLSRHFANS
jgi:hypothetical protein